jgi:hypothetical protein
MAVALTSPGSAAWRWPLLFLALAMAALLAWQPLSGLLSPVQASYNEGWNAYRQHAASIGFPLYGTPPGYFVTNYTPLSFHVVGLIGRLGFDVVLAGRVLSVVSLISVCLACGGITFLVCRDRWAAVVAALLFWIWLAVFDEVQFGLNDPQLFGMAMLMAGYFQYLRMGSRLGGVIAPAVLFSLALMVKQSFIPIPLCVGLHLVLERRYREACVFSLVGLVCCGAMFGLFYLIDGPHLLGNWFFSRFTSWELAVEKTTPFAVRFQIPVLTALFVIVSRFQRDGLVRSLAISLAGSVAIGFVAVAGDGVNQNLYFDALFLVCVLAASHVATMGPALAVALLLPALLVLPRNLLDDATTKGEAAIVARDHAAALAIIRAQPGPALCEHMTLCYDAGKPMTYDPFFVSDQLRVHILHEDAITDLIDRQCYGAVELEMWRNEASVQPMARPRFSAVFMTHLFARYHVVLASHDVANGVAVFLPNPGAAPGPPCPDLPALPARS